MPQFLKIMGNRVSRSTLFGIPLQQQWSFGTRESSRRPTTCRPMRLFTTTRSPTRTSRARIVLSKDQQARFDPMITGFNPADMYAADHIRRVLRTFPGVFTGHRRVHDSQRIRLLEDPGETASLTNPALDRILDFAGEAGLVCILHNDVDMPFAKTDAEPVYLSQMKALLRRHPKTSIIWAQSASDGSCIRSACRRRRPSEPGPCRHRRDAGQDPHSPCELRHLLGRGRQIHRGQAGGHRPRLVDAERISDRFLFGTDTVAPASPIRTSPCSTCGRRVETAHAGNESRFTKATTSESSTRPVRACARGRQANRK